LHADRRRIAQERARQTQTRRDEKKQSRTGDLPQPVWVALKAHEKRQKAERLKVGSAWRNRGLVFTTDSELRSTRRTSAARRRRFANPPRSTRSRRTNWGATPRLHCSMTPAWRSRRSPTYSAIARRECSRLTTATGSDRPSIATSSMSNPSSAQDEARLHFHRAGPIGWT
jgi:hypothetical protein